MCSLLSSSMSSPWSSSYLPSYLLLQSALHFGRNGWLFTFSLHRRMLIYLIASSPPGSLVVTPLCFLLLSLAHASVFPLFICSPWKRNKRTKSYFSRTLVRFPLYSVLLVLLRFGLFLFSCLSSWCVTRLPAFLFLAVVKTGYKQATKYGGSGGGVKRRPFKRQRQRVLEASSGGTRRRQEGGKSP